MLHWSMPTRVRRSEVSTTHPYAGVDPWRATVARPITWAHPGMRWAYTMDHPHHPANIQITIDP